MRDCTRLDNTTNWSVAGLGVAMSISFSRPDASALPILCPNDPSLGLSRQDHHFPTPVTSFGEFVQRALLMLWTAPSTGSEAPTRWWPIKPPRFGGRHMKTVTTIGLDIAKSVFEVHGVDTAGKVVVRKQLTRGRVLPFFMKLPPCLVGIEACASLIIGRGSYNNGAWT